MTKKLTKRMKTVRAPSPPMSPAEAGDVLRNAVVNGTLHPVVLLRASASGARPEGLHTPAPVPNHLILCGVVGEDPTWGTVTVFYNVAGVPLNMAFRPEFRFMLDLVADVPAQTDDDGSLVPAVAYQKITLFVRGEIPDDVSPVALVVNGVEFNQQRVD